MHIIYFEQRKRTSALQQAVLSNIHSSAVMNLVLEAASIFPETLRLDIHHLVDLFYLKHYVWILHHLADLQK